MLEEICRKLGVYPEAVRKLAGRIYDAYKDHEIVKSSNWPYSIGGLKDKLGYQHHPSFKKHIYALLAYSTFGNFGEIIDEPGASILRLLPKQVVLDPPEQEEYDAFLEEFTEELREDKIALVVTPIGATIGACIGAILDKEHPEQGAGLGGGVGALLGFLASKALKVATMPRENPEFQCQVCGAYLACDINTIMLYCSACGSKYASVPACPTCNKDLRWEHTYQMWYCISCDIFSEAMDLFGEKIGDARSINIGCSRCFELFSIRQPSKSEVLASEYLMYTCPHCNGALPLGSQDLLPYATGVVSNRVPTLTLTDDFST